MHRRHLLTTAFLLTLGAPRLTLTESGAPATLTVFAAASLSDAFKELGTLLEQREPGLSVRFSFAGSQQLALQLQQGADADVFASADQRWMGVVTDSGLVAGESHLFARNRLVVIVPASNPARIDRLEDLVRRGTKLILAAEAVPVGKYSREVLDKLSTAPGFPADFTKRVQANVVSQEDNVKAIVGKVQLGEADAGIVYRSDVTPAVARMVHVLEIPDSYNVLASYPIAVLKSSRNASRAQAFVDLVLSPEGQVVLKKYGLIPAGASAPAGAGT